MDMVVVLPRPDAFDLSYEIPDMFIFALDFGLDQRIFDIDPREGPSHGALE